MSRVKKLFAPGPVNTSERVKKAALHPDICHRNPDFERIYSEVRSNLLKLFGVTSENYTTVVVSGSGTAANETVISSVFEKGSEVLLITNGEFGIRLKNIFECYGIILRSIELDWGEYPDLDTIENNIKKYKNIKAVSMVFHETSTGMINPVHEVGCLAKKYNKLYFVDAISAVGGEKVNVSEDYIDFCTGVPNKSVAGHPGTSFICVNKAVIPEIQAVPRRNIYLNLQHHIKLAEEHNQTPNTPSVVMFITLNEALKELFEEGLDNRIERYKKDAKIIRNGLKNLNLKFLINDEKIMANTVTSVFLPEKIKVENFIDRMDEEGFVLYPGKGPLLEKNMFQVANMGHIYPSDCEELIEVIRKILKQT